MMKTNIKYFLAIGAVVTLISGCTQKATTLSLPPAHTILNNSLEIPVTKADGQNQKDYWRLSEVSIDSWKIIVTHNGKVVDTFSTKGKIKELKQGTLFAMNGAIDMDSKNYSVKGLLVNSDSTSGMVILEPGT